jgi:hypothetical protein
VGTETGCIWHVKNLYEAQERESAQENDKDERKPV